MRTLAMCVIDAGYTVVDLFLSAIIEAFHNSTGRIALLYRCKQILISCASVDLEFVVVFLGVVIACQFQAWFFLCLCLFF